MDVWRILLRVAGAAACRRIEEIIDKDYLIRL